MQAKTEELLYLLLWGADQLFRPTFRNLNESFEAWAYREGFQQQLRKLQQRRFLEGRAKADGQRQYRLSNRGRIVALGGRDPVAAWDRPWDGQWRLVIFDLPESQNATRTRLRRFLKARAFGFLQNSVWITPDPLGSLLKPWAAAGQGVESLITLEARSCSGESNEAIVSGAWDFDHINALYRNCLTVLEQFPRQRSRTRRGHEFVLRWARAEQAAWRQAVSVDPLLPRRLLPNNYLGETVWKRRQECLAKASRLALR